MEILSSVNRRQFLSGLFSITAAGLLSRQNNAIASNQPIDHSARMNMLISVLQEHHTRHDGVLHDEQKTNLIYAFEKIKPTNHLEETIVVACAMSMQSVYNIVDEYVRRRKGEAPRLPAHSAMLLKGWGVPDTYGILLFREQISALLAEVTGASLGYGKELCLEMTMGCINTRDFRSELAEEYREFNGDQIMAVYDAVLFYAPAARPYVWCSAMVSRADALVMAL